jgi:outer membrane lipase/esterase
MVAMTLCHAVVAFAQISIAGITFSPASIPGGGTSLMSIALGNASEADATLTRQLTDTLPPGMRATAVSGGSCTAAAVGLAAGGGAVTYAPQATLPSGGCTIVVSVTASVSPTNSSYTNTIPIGALQTTLGANAAAASATLAVQAAALVPNVVGQSQVAAANALRAAGLTVGAITQAPGPAGIPFNAVFAQVPAAGTSQPAGTVVTLQVSTGPGNAANPNSPLTSVPNFVDPSQLSVAAAFERVCAALQAPGVNLTAGQQRLLNNCVAIIGSHGGGADPAGLKSTLDAISGRQSTAQQRTGVNFSGTQFTNVGARLAQLRQGATGGSLAGLDFGVPNVNGMGPLLAFLEDITGIHKVPGFAEGVGGGSGDDDSSSASIVSRLGFFVNGALRRGSQDTTLNESGFDFRSTGITAGVDYRFTENIVLGLALNHLSGKTNFDAASGRLDSRNNAGSIYGTYYRDAFYVDVIGTFGSISYDAARSTSFDIDSDSTTIPSNCTADSCAIDTQGSTHARQLAFGTNVGYSFHDRGLVFGPDVAVDYTRIDVDGFRESDLNSSGMDLIFGEQRGESLLVKAGGHASYAFNTRFAVLLPTVRAHYIHEFKNDQQPLNVHFAEDPTIGTPEGPVGNFVVFTDRPDRGYFDWSAGCTAQFAFGVSAFAEYNALAGAGGLHTHEFTLGVRIERLRQ